MTETSRAPRSHSYAVGDITVSVIDDGFRKIPVTDGYCLNASAAEMNAALEAGGLKPGVLHNPFQPIVLTIGTVRVLFDTGNGEGAFAESKGERGNLPRSLAAAGMSREDIDVVVISHCHGDHVNGLVTADGKAAFPRAEIKVPSVEWRFWMDDGEMSRAPAGRMTDLFKNNRRVFDALDRKVTPYDWDREVAPGVTAVGTAGHSIGHTSFVVSSGSHTLYLLSDVCINNPPLFVAHPGWHTVNDQDPVQAEATRRRVLTMLAAEEMKVQAFHFPWPGVGHIEKAGEGFRFLPLTS
jgi:glyoxylase-like metal-dependent hydrolase (beta-lactamase superfamily II)